MSLPFGKGTTSEEVIDIVTQSGIKCLTIPIKSPAWDINPETITIKEITKIIEIIPSSVEVTGLGYSWPSEYTMITDSAIEWKRNLNYANKLTETASSLGVQHIVVGSGGRSVPSDYPFYDGRARAKTVIKALSRILRVELIS